MKYEIYKQKTRYPQQSARYGRKPNVIVLHETGSGRGTVAEIRAIKAKTFPGCFHTIVSDQDTAKLIPYDRAAYSNSYANLRTLNIGVCITGKDWERHAKYHTFIDWIYNMAFEAVRMGQWVRDEHGIDIPATRLTREQYLAGESGVIGHNDLNVGCGCFDSTFFPWNDFLSIYNKILNPRETSPEILLTEAAAVSWSPGIIATQILKNYDTYHDIGSILMRSLPDDLILRICFYRFQTREPSDIEMVEMRKLAAGYGLESVVQEMCNLVNVKYRHPSRLDKQIFKIQNG